MFICKVLIKLHLFSQIQLLNLDGLTREKAFYGLSGANLIDSLNNTIVFHGGGKNGALKVKNFLENLDAETNFDSLRFVMRTQDDVKYFSEYFRFNEFIKGEKIIIEPHEKWVVENGSPDFSKVFDPGTKTMVENFCFTSLTINTFDVPSCEFLRGATTIESLTLNSGVGNIEALSTLTNLEYLSLNNCESDNLSSLENLVSLSELSIKNNKALTEPFYKTGDTTPYYSMQILVDLNPNSTSTTKKNGQLTKLYIDGCTGLRAEDKAKLSAVSWAKKSGF